MKKIVLLLVFSLSVFAGEVLDGNSDTTTVEGRAQYARYLYYTVNGAANGYSIENQSHLDLVNSVIGSKGIGGILYEAGYENCEAIPTTGTLNGTVQNMSLTLTLAAGSKAVPATYGSDAGATMDKKITVTAGSDLNMVVELKCNDDTSIQSGYLLMDFSSYDVKTEAYFQMNSTTGATYLDVYTTTVLGNGGRLIIPTQFKTTDGQNFDLYTAYINVNSGTNTVIAIKGEASGKAQLAYLNSYATTGDVMSKTPNNWGDLTSGMETKIEINCVNMQTNTETTGCTAISAPSTISMNGNANTWTLTDLKNISLSSI